MSDGVIAAIVTATGGVIVALITVYARRLRGDAATPLAAGDQPKQDTPIRGFELSGRWHGEHDWAGWAYDFTMHLQVIQSQVKGQIDWTLNQCPPESGLVKQIGKSGVEYVKGFLEENVLTLSGYRVDKPNLVEPADYSLTIREDLKTFDGRAKGKKIGSGGPIHGRAIVSR